MTDYIQVVSWSNRRHWANPHVPRSGSGMRKAICGPYTWGWADGEEPRGHRHYFTPEKVAAMPFCKHCERKAKP